jgi:nicotinate phosphoribosyltransferase
MISKEYTNALLMASQYIHKLEYLILRIANNYLPSVQRRHNELQKENNYLETIGVGTELSTSRDDPAMNGVYKLVALRIIETLDDTKAMTSNHNMLSYKLKSSPGKRTYPGPKQIQRILKNEKMVEDIVELEGEKETSSSLCVPLLQKILDNGGLVYEMLETGLDYYQKQYVQAITSIEEGMLESCNGFRKPSKFD